MTRAGILVLCAACNFASPEGKPAVDASSGDGPGNLDDRDGDGIANSVDLCPDVPDPMQRDHDADGAVAIVTGLVGSSGAVTQFYQCALFRSGPQIGARSFVGGSVLADIYASWTGGVTGGVTVDVVSRFAAMFECSYAAPATTVRSTLGPTAGELELLVQDATASFDYLFVVEAGS